MKKKSILFKSLQLDAIYVLIICDLIISAFVVNCDHKHITRIPRWNNVEATVSTSFQRGIHIVYLYIHNCFQTLSKIYDGAYLQKYFMAFNR